MSNGHGGNSPGDRVDWDRVRETIDLGRVISRELGDPPGRRGTRDARPWWHCPFHPDANPSLTLTPGATGWKCFGCGAKGDAVSFLRGLNPGLTFPEAARDLAGEPACARPPRVAIPAGSSPGPVRRPVCSGLPEHEAVALVGAAARRLWGLEGAEALGYLRSRGLDEATIRAARIGFAPPLDLPGRPRGIVLCWFSGGLPALVKLRQPEGREPRYREVFRDRGRLPEVFPGPEAVEVGRPLVIVEGEFDALLLGQDLAGLAAVVTLGSASARPDASTLGPLLAATPWYIATDADPAGDRAAGAWPARARRVRPPGPFKDWSEAHQAGVKLRRWWCEVFAGVASPALFTWDELAGWRWGPAAGDETSGIESPRPSRAAGPGHGFVPVEGMQTTDTLHAACPA